MQILLSRTQEVPGKTVKQEQEEISPNHVHRINLISVVQGYRVYGHLHLEERAEPLVLDEPLICFEDTERISWKRLPC